LSTVVAATRVVVACWSARRALHGRHGRQPGLPSHHPAVGDGAGHPVRGHPGHRDPRGAAARADRAAGPRGGPHGPRRTAGPAAVRRAAAAAPGRPRPGADRGRVRRQVHQRPAARPAHRCGPGRGADLMTVAYVCTDPGVPAFGRKGASVHVQAVLAALQRRGEQVHLVTARPGGPVPLALAGLTVHQVPRARHADPAAREVASQQADAEVTQILDHLHTSDGVHLVYERYSLWGRAASAWARDHQVPHLLEVNAPLVQEQAEHRVLVDRAGAEDVAAAALSATTAAVCVSDPVATWARRHAADPARVHTLANGVDTTRITPGPPLAEEPFTVGFVGTLKPWHGLPVLLEALALVLA